MATATDQYFEGSHDAAHAYRGLISGERSFPTMRISNKPPGGPSEASSHSETIMVPDDDVHDQAYNEVLRWSYLLPALGEAAARLEAVIPQNRDLADKFGTSKIFLDESIKLLSISRDAIDRLDRKDCHRLLRAIGRAVSSLRRKFPPPRDEVQCRASIIYLQPEEVSQFGNPSHEVISSNWHDLLYLELHYMCYMYSQLLINEHTRLEALITKFQVPAIKVSFLKFFLEKSVTLLALKRDEIARAHKKECRILAKMTKLFVLCKLIKGYANEGVVFEWPLSTHYALSEVLLQMHMKSSSDQVGPTLVFDAGAWLLKDDWHDDAYKQLLSMRTLYSSQLDDAYTSIYIPRLCNVLSLEARKFLKKSLVFLATSRAEMVSLSIEKCYYRMMLIKFFAVLSSDGVHADQHPYKLQGHGSRSQIQSESLPYWRDLVHEEIGAIRKEYSYALDEAFRTKLGLCAEKPALDLFKTFNESFFEEALDFLGYSRAEIASESEAKCTDYMKRIREFGRQILNSSHEDSRRGLAKFIELLSRPCQVQNWRDEAYAEIKSKETKFWKVEAACEKVHVMSSYKIIPSLAPQWEEELGNSLGRTREFFTMSRSNLARLSKEEYDTRVEVINGDLARIEEKLTCLQISLGKRISFPCDFCKVKLKQRSNA